MGGRDPRLATRVGAEGGQATVTRLENLSGRADANWHKVSAEQNTEILRRRLQNPLGATFACRLKKTGTTSGDPMGQQRPVPAGVPLGPPPAPDARRPPGDPANLRPALRRSI